jgi:hypothetical protein
MKKIKIILVSFMLISVLASCLKSARMNTDPTQSVNIVEFANTGDFVSGSDSTYQRFHIDMGQVPAGAVVNFNINVRYGGGGDLVAPQDITLNLAIDNGVLSAYNQFNHSGFVVPAASIFQIPSSVVIKKGTSMSQVTGKIIVSPDYDFAKEYALPIKITSASLGTVSSKYGGMLYSFSARNQYDGIYTVVSGLVTRYTAPGSPAGDALSGPLAGNPDVYLITVGASSVRIPPSGATGGLYWAAGSNSMVAGIDGLQAAISQTTNAVTMNSGGNATLTNWAGHENSYDPATKTFKLAFRWNPTANVREYEVVLKYKSGR